MKVKTRITFEVEYPLEMNGESENVALEMEKIYIASNPISTLDVFEARGEGIFTVEVKKAEVE